MNRCSQPTRLSAPDPTTTRADALQDALERLEGYGYLDAPGFACHGPMAAETLSTLGHDDLVGAWVEDYKRRHRPLEVPPPRSRLDASDEHSWMPALGDLGRVSDWAVMFRHQLAEQPYPAVLERWLPRLLSGYAGGLTHGLIRVAHAVRAVPVDGPPSDLVLDEVAHGLAFWAATFTTLPGRPELRGPLTLTEAIAGLPRPHPPWAMMEAGTFARIDELDRFPAAVEALGPRESGDGALSDLTASFCAVILAHPGVAAVPLVHTVTPATAMRTLQRFLPELSIEAAYAQLWHVGAAIVAAFTPSGAPGVTAPREAAESLAPAEIVGRAVEHRDTHALKFAEACTREHAIRPDPVYLLAAQQVIEQLPPW
jgi:Questin oxidase-like